MKWNEKIFRKNDIRGIYKKDFDRDFVKALAKAFICFHQKNNISSSSDKKLVIAVGHDCRLSSPEIAGELSESLAGAGAEVRFMGMVPSPLCYFASYFYDSIQASFMVTASHNPPDFNGFKMMLHQQTLYGEKILQLKKLIGKPIPGSSPEKIIPLNVEKDYISCFHKSFCSPSPDKASPLKKPYE